MWPAASTAMPLGLSKSPVPSPSLPNVLEVRAVGVEDLHTEVHRVGDDTAGPRRRPRCGWDSSTRRGRTPRRPNDGRREPVALTPTTRCPSVSTTQDAVPAAATPRRAKEPVPAAQASTPSCRSRSRHRTRPPTESVTNMRLPRNAMPMSDSLSTRMDRYVRLVEAEHVDEARRRVGHIEPAIRSNRHAVRLRHRGRRSPRRRAPSARARTSRAGRASPPDRGCARTGCAPARAARAIPAPGRRRPAGSRSGGAKRGRDDEQEADPAHR